MPLFLTILSSDLPGENPQVRDVAKDIAVDGTGQVFVTGFTESGNFLARNNLESVGFPHFEGRDAFVVKLSDTLDPIAFTYLGGSNNDQGLGIAVDASGVYVTGSTESSDFQTHVSPIFDYTPSDPNDTDPDPEKDAFVIKLHPSLTPFEKPFERTVSGFPPQADQPMAGRRRVSGCRRCR